MNTYKITFRNRPDGYVLAGYDARPDSAVLVHVEIHIAPLTAEKSAEVCDWLPKYEDDLLARNSPHYTLQKVETDLSFGKFWETYAYKIGKKDRAFNLWTNLSELDQSACLQAIPKYKYWLAQRTGIERLYPETFLSQRRWENEFKAG